MQFHGRWSTIKMHLVGRFVNGVAVCFFLTSLPIIRNIQGVESRDTLIANWNWLTLCGVTAAVVTTFTTRNYADYSNIGAMIENYQTGYSHQMVRDKPATSLKEILVC